MSELQETGERFHPSMRGRIRYEHLHRYALCLGLVDGRDVLDIASGEGYGTALLASRAKRVTGVDIETRAVEHARRSYYRTNVRYLTGGCTAIPLADDAVDVVVSFETLEHVDDHDQMLSEIRRVLRPGGRLVISSPNRLEYSDQAGYTNPYHVRELYFDEFVRLLERNFPAVSVHGQRLAAASFVYPLVDRSTVDLPSYGANGGDTRDGLPVLERPLYFIAICGETAEDAGGIDSVFLDAHDDVLRTLEDERTVAMREVAMQRDAIAALTDGRRGPDYIEGQFTNEQLRIESHAGQRAPEVDVEALHCEIARLTALQDLREESDERWNAERDALLAERAAIAAERNAIAADRDSIAAYRDALLADRDSTAAHRDALLADRDSTAAYRDALKKERDGLITERDTITAERDAAIAERQLAADDYARLEKLLDVASHAAERAYQETAEMRADTGRLQRRTDSAVREINGLRERLDANNIETSALRHRSGLLADTARRLSALVAVYEAQLSLSAPVQRTVVAGTAEPDSAVAPEPALLENVLASRSWKLTAPLRAAARSVRRKP